VENAEELLLKNREFTAEARNATMLIPCDAGLHVDLITSVVVATVEKLSQENTGTLI